MNKNTISSGFLNFIVTVSIFSALFLSVFFTSCVSLTVGKPVVISRKIADKGVLTADQLTKYFIENNPKADFHIINDFAQIYIKEAAMEGINSDVAFAQMCLETGYLTFGNLVTSDMNNFCGLGAIDAEHPGEIFATPELGVRAHIQHLQAYATTADVKLNNELVDPRYNWVHKTKYIETIYQLAGTWAMDQDYGSKLDNILNRMENLIN